MEQGLDAVVREGLDSGRLQFVVGAPVAARQAEFVYLAVPTPQGDDGSADLSFIEGAAREIGPVLAETLVRFFGEPQNTALIERLRKRGLTMESPDTADESVAPVFSGQTIVVTGTLESWTRDEVRALIEARGGRVASSVSKTV